jgi:uncharacterized protein DUF4397
MIISGETMSASPLVRRLAALAVAALAALGLCLVQASPAAAAAPGGYVRLAHLVPDTIACDMYIQLHSVTGDVKKYLPSVKYGGISEYVMVPAGTYAVSMRKPGAGATTPPVLSTSFTVVDGRAYTVARMGTPGKAIAQVTEDDRTLPEGGKAKLRVMQAAQRTLEVSVVDGATIAKDLTFTTTTGYQGVDPGNRTLRVQPAGGQATTVSATMTAGSIYSLLVLEAPDGGVTAVVLADAKRAGAVPRGGVATGAGGSQRPVTNPIPLVAALLVLSGGGLIALLARRWKAARP